MSLLPAAAALFMLFACAPQTHSSSQPPPAQTAEKEQGVQKLASKDGKIQILIQNGRFADISDTPSHRPEGVSADELTLLQYDASRDITLYASNLGEAKTQAAAYFANLKQALESTEGLSDIRIGAATDNRMNYRFSQPASDGRTKLTENCIAIHETHLYNVCASSQTASQDDLVAVLKDVNLIK